jgi:hypothetical protein
MEMNRIEMQYKDLNTFRSEPSEGIFDVYPKLCYSNCEIGDHIAVWHNGVLLEQGTVVGWEYTSEMVVYGKHLDDREYKELMEEVKV